MAVAIANEPTAPRSGRPAPSFYRQVIMEQHASPAFHVSPAFRGRIGESANRRASEAASRVPWPLSRECIFRRVLHRVTMDVETFWRLMENARFGSSDVHEEMGT